MLPDNLGYLFDAPLKLIPDQPAILQDDLVLTFEGLDARTNRLANLLRTLGVGPGDRVALMFSNDFRFLESLFAPMRLGAVAVPLNTRMGDEALRYVLEDAEARVVIVSRTMSARAAQLLAGIPTLQHVIADGGDGLAGALEYEEGLASVLPTLARRTTRPDEICMQPYTSGSTGKPKGVLLGHYGQIWNADVMRKSILADHTERALVAVPLYHKNALAGAVKPFLLAGGSIVIQPGFDPIPVIQAIERYRVTYMTGVPAMYTMLLAEREALARHDVRSLRYAICGSAEVPDELLQEFRRVFGAAIAEGYGLTEGGPVPVCNSRWAVKKRGSCGREIPGCDVDLRDADGRSVGVDEVGELVTRNPGVAQGYWKRPEQTAAKFKAGWLLTGDLMRRDAEGYYYFVGRKDDMINVAGENVYPKEIEDILMQHPHVRDVCVVPARSTVKGEVPIAFVVTGEPTSEEELKAFFLTLGAPYAHPRRVYFLDALPLTSTGKPDRQGLKQRGQQVTV
jgi:long-chain acyl-CoA synthetase